MKDCSELFSTKKLVLYNFNGANKCYPAGQQVGNMGIEHAADRIAGPLPVRAVVHEIHHMARIGGKIAQHVCFGSMLLGKLLYRRYPYEKSSILRYGTLITNASFAGMTIISGAYGQKALFYASVFIIPNRIFMWSAGISLFTQADLKTRIKNVVLSPGIIAIALGVLRPASAESPAERNQRNNVRIGTVTIESAVVRKIHFDPK